MEPSRLRPGGWRAGEAGHVARERSESAALPKRYFDRPNVATRPADLCHERRRNGYGISPPFLDRTAASDRSSDSTSAGSATVSAIS